MAMLHNLLSRGIVMLHTQYKEYFKSAFYHVVEWGVDIYTQNSNGPGFSGSVWTPALVQKLRADHGGEQK